MLASASRRRSIASAASRRSISSSASTIAWRRVSSRAVCDAVDDLAVALLHALGKLDPLDQVGEVVRADDQRHDVRLVGLVGRDELRGEQLAAVREPDA